MEANYFSEIGYTGKLHFALEIMAFAKYRRLSGFTMCILTAPQNYARGWSQKSESSILVPKHTKYISGKFKARFEDGFNIFWASVQRVDPQFGK